MTEIPEGFKHVCSISTNHIWNTNSRMAANIPPVPKASFHFPEHAKLYVFTSPAHQIVWLPEQTLCVAMGAR
jgi:hypothetical protein